MYWIQFYNFHNLTTVMDMLHCGRVLRTSYIANLQSRPAPSALLGAKDAGNCSWESSQILSLDPGKFSSLSASVYGLQKTSHWNLILSSLFFSCLLDFLEMVATVNQDLGCVSLLCPSSLTMASFHCLQLGPFVDSKHKQVEVSGEETQMF